MRSKVFRVRNLRFVVGWDRTASYPWWPMVPSIRGSTRFVIVHQRWIGLSAGRRPLWFSLRLAWFWMSFSERTVRLTRRERKLIARHAAEHYPYTYDEEYDREFYRTKVPR